MLKFNPMKSSKPSSSRKFVQYVYVENMPSENKVEDVVSSRCQEGETQREMPIVIQDNLLSPVGSPKSYVQSSIDLSYSGADVTNDPNWQASKHTIKERQAVMFNNEYLADVHFIVGSNGQTRRIPAHKYILATGSSVFHAMFYGSLPETRESISITDAEPAAFLTLLRYLYCDEVKLNVDTVLDTLYISKKYLVPHLARACVDLLQNTLNEKNACLLLSQSRFFEEPDLMKKCCDVIDVQAETILQAEGFLDIDINTLESVFSRETLNCQEKHLFSAALNWAAMQCARKDMEPTPQNKRAVLGKALNLIRFPAMALEDFADEAAQSGILTSQETIDIFLHFTARDKPHIEFMGKPRTGLKPKVCHRFQSSAYKSNQWRYRGRVDSIQFSVDKRIFVVGFGLYGSSNGACSYDATLELKLRQSTLETNKTKFFSDGSSNTFRVYFCHPIQVEPECLYTASVVLEGRELSYFGQEGLSEVSAAGVTFQFQCSSESTNGTGVQGGQIPELIFYAPRSEED